MKQEDSPEKTLFGITIDIDTNVRGTESCNHNSQIYNCKDNKRDFITIQVYKNN